MSSAEYMRGWKFNMSLPELAKFWERHNWECSICGKAWDSNARGGGLIIDHNHKCCNSKTKTCGMCTRGALCGSCNVGLGRANDSPQTLKAAVTYLNSSHIDFSYLPVRKRKNQMGDKHPSAKHSNKKIKELRRRLLAKEYTTKVALAEEFGINPASIYNYTKSDSTDYVAPYNLEDFIKNNVPLKSLASRAHRAGISQFQLEALYVVQLFKCAICQAPSREKKLVLDHDHKCCPSQAGMLSGKAKEKHACGKCVRGLLCYNCNALISCFKESDALLNAAYDYVR